MVSGHLLHSIFSLLVIFYDVLKQCKYHFFWVFSFIHLFLFVSMVSVLSSGLKFLTIFICDVHVCHGPPGSKRLCSSDMSSTLSLSAVDLEQHRCELCRPTYMQIISVVNTTLLHGPMVESADTKQRLDVEGLLFSYVQIFNCTAGLCL